MGISDTVSLWILSQSILTVKFQKSWPLKFQAGSLQPKVLIARKWNVTGLIRLAQVIPHTFKPSMTDEKDNYRFPFPVYSTFNILLPVSGWNFQRISPKGRKQNLRGSPLKQFLDTTTLSPGKGQIKGSSVLQNQLETWLLKED